MRSDRFERGGQEGWRHDEGHAAGVFNTYDRFDLGFLGPRRVHVLMPRGQQTACPTVYFQDGDTTFWKGGAVHATWDVAGTLSAAHGEVEPLIVVAIHPVERNREYTHTDWAAGSQPWGGLPDYAAWLATHVKPWVDEHYPTNPARSAIVGSSHGGLAAFWAATRHPGAFRAAGCLSPSFFAGLDDLQTGERGPGSLVASELVTGVASTLADPQVRPRVWMCWGTRRDGGPHNAIVEALAASRSREMAQLLVERFHYRPGQDLWMVEDPGAGHDEGAWRRRFGAMIRALFAPGER